MGHELSFALGWALLGAVSLLFLFSVWYLLTATDDYRKVKDTPSAREAVVLVSVGAVMEGWLKLIAASLWLVVGIWVVNVPATGRWQGRSSLS
jgi:predicted Abi (CAAX) family protease